MNMRDRLKANTANLTPAADREVTETAEDTRPKTGIGLVNKLSQADRRIAELEAELAAKGAAGKVAVARIRPNPWQPRRRFVEARLQELAESIKEVGLMQPVLLRRVTEKNGEEFFELIAGERRWRAHQILAWSEIDVIITKATDAEMAVMALTENISREDLTDYEISKAMQRVENEFPDRKRMAEALGLGRGTLYRFLSFSHLPPYMIADLEEAPELFGGNAASDTVAVLKKLGAAADATAKELWEQLKAGSLDQSKFAPTLTAAVARRESPSANHTSQRDIHKVYAGKSQAGSITKDASNFTVKLKSSAVTPAQEERIRALISELYGDGPNA